ncbi:triose-phosphate isomerase [Mycoplasma seminis]|uniref:Triosephosphate isomerase n=1 Tax=Mycoplasma seminis TaxID=512749 RepID=A0ABY9H9T4_9MOLU|nr:triose-phosphate isomerase [Mycoplasma seminis]WLP85339.1 triose-phosphate isomerase [Mycoplasma seminis]
MNKILIIGNWKMNTTYSQCKGYIEKIKDFYLTNEKIFQDNIYFGIAAPYIALPAFANLNLDHFVLVSQNVSSNSCGSFTGDISAQMLKDLDVKYGIVGHNERRIYHGETNAKVNAKAKALISQGIIPIICVGEDLQQFEQGLTNEVIKAQVLESTKDLPADKYVIAYEPIWATGTGKCASSCQAQEVSKFIRSLVNKKCRILYGGSVTEENVTKLINKDDIDGFLIGKAALDSERFFEIIKKVYQAKN